MRRAMIWLACLVAAASWAEPPDGWFEFVIPMIAQDSIVDVARYNAGPAGASGFVRIEDGRFVTGDGERIRFLGTNLTFADAFPEKERAPEIARRMAALGINIVRFHHLDRHHAPRGIWDPAYDDHQHIDAEQLDRLDWLIYQLREHGIYSNINLHVSRQFTEADGFPDPDLRPRYDKGLNYFEPRMIELQREYARELLTHVNPYTGNAYVDEPCVAMVEITNENSAVRFALGRELHTLPEPYATTLRALWCEWLEEQYGDTEALRAAWDGGSEPLGDEMLRDPELEQGVDEWVLEAPSPAEAVLETMEDSERGRVIRAELTNPGAQHWDFQVHQRGHTFEDGRPYTLSFAAKADPPREIHVSIRHDAPDWRMAGLDETIELGEEWREFSLTFMADDPLPDNTRLSFNNRNVLGEVWYADISLRPGGVYGLAEDQSIEQGDVELPTASAVPQAHTDWLSFVMELERRYTTEMYELLKDELGLQAAVTNTQATYGGAAGLLRESRMDYIDTHAYWQHPHFPGTPWDPGEWFIRNSPMTAELGDDTLTRLSMYRITDMPYTVSEYNHPAPNDYRAEGMPMFAAFAGLQDWDGVFQFDYGAHPEDWTESRVRSYFRMESDPAALAMFPVAANLFRRGDVPAASESATLLLPRGRIAEFVREHGNTAGPLWSQAGIEREDALRRRLYVDWTSEDEPKLMTNGGADARDPVQWWSEEDDGGVFVVDTPNTKVLLGPIAGRAFELDGVRFDIGATGNGYAAVALTSMDDRPLAESEQMLLVALNGVENQQMGWNEERTTVRREWGHGPTICEGVPVTVSIDGNRDLSAWALAGDGTHKAEIAGRAEEDIRVDVEYETIWYELSPR